MNYLEMLNKMYDDIKASVKDEYIRGRLISHALELIHYYQSLNGITGVQATINCKLPVLEQILKV